MYLKAVTLHGFKTFAPRTTLAFAPGITAIVGPNGSGKSNFADALRWVLGEQSLRSLRSRRTEDVVFAGGRGRAPAGMAEVELVFDNAGRLLDVPFTEISVARRAYRSGENEYYLNRDRVRLRDVSDLLSRISLESDGFAIVGQGMVDAALSIRAEDRRALIDQAAAIGHLYSRLDDARDRLTNAEQNLARVADLRAELMPRVRTLERQARQARERETLQIEFFRGLIHWYAHLWSIPFTRQRQALVDRERATAELQRAIAEMRVVDDAASTAHSRRAAIDESIQAAKRRRGERAAALRALESIQDRDASRRSSLQRALGENGLIVDQNRQDLAREDVLVADLLIQQSLLTNQIAAIEAELVTAEQTAQEWQSRRVELERRVRDAHAAQTRAEARYAAAVARHRAAQDRIAHIERSLSDQERRIDALQAEAIESERLVTACQTTLDERRADLARCSAERDASAEQLACVRSELAQHDAQISLLERDLHALRARCDALDQLEASGSGYFAGVRVVLQAANGHGKVHLDGVVGVVARLIEVGADKEIALEVALGSHVQDVVVDRWTDAEAAIAHLKRSGAGRATFLPLDTLRPPRRSPPPTGSGILGVASDLVVVDPRFQRVTDFLLGQTLVVEDLAVARRVLSVCAPFWQIVTLEGEITRPSGVVTGGAPGQSHGALARQRELRQGRQTLAKREAEHRGIDAAASSVRRDVDVLSTRVAELARSLKEAEDQSRRAATSLADAQHQNERAHQTLAMQRQEVQRGINQKTVAERALADCQRAVTEAERERTETLARLNAAQSDYDALSHEWNDTSTELFSKRSERESVHERLLALKAALNQAEARRSLLTSQMRDREAHGREICAEIHELEQQAGRQEHERASVVKEIAEIDSEITELQGDLQTATALERACDERRRHLDTAEREAREHLRDAERRVDLADTEVYGLRQQVFLEMGGLDEAALERGELQVTPATGATYAAAIETLTDPDRARARLDSLRARLRNIPIGLDAIAEYENTRERADFLGKQAADLHRTIETLRAAIDETKATMRSRFDQTFAVVAAGFSRRFGELFGGGTARLVVDGDGESSGVDVIAQPPGKRAEGLSMLSGGERALTAAALLFALVEANPPPFCVLDEVDAALDESNVGRFCSALKELSARTQFIVITHNRRTMEAASTIYGLAIENGSESRVLALRLPEP